jgi:curli biogenesis system outer membrane secretion channel CsgG
MNRLISKTAGLVMAFSGLAFVPTLTFYQPVAAQGVGGLGTEQIKPREKRRIAVLDFDFASISDMSVLSGVGGGGASKGISDLLTNQLFKDGSYILVERSRVATVLNEQNLGASGRIEATTAAQIGRVLGVDAVLIGSVTKFSYGSKKDVSFGDLFMGSRKQIATVQISARLISTATGEILSVAEGTGQSEQRVSAGGGFGGGLFGLASVGSSGAGNGSGALEDAAEKAVTALSAQIVAAAPQVAAIPTVAPRVNAVIADITGNQIVLNKGGNDGFRPGMILSIERVTKTVKDPSTGKVLRVVSQSIGRIQLVDVDAGSAVGKVVAGRVSSMRVGDRAKSAE